MPNRLKHPLLFQILSLLSSSPSPAAFPQQPHISSSDVSSCRYFKPLWWYPALCRRMGAGGFSLISQDGCKTRASRVRARQTGRELYITGKKEPNSCWPCHSLEGWDVPGALPVLWCPVSLGWGCRVPSRPGETVFHLHSGQAEALKAAVATKVAAKLTLGCLDSDLEERFCVNQAREVFPI